MYRNQTNKVAIRTQRAVSNALIALIQDFSYEEISVTDICRCAEVVRKTFYNNFQSKDDVVHYIISDIFHEMEAMLDLRYMSVRQMLLIAFKFVMDNRLALLLFYNRGLLRFAHKSISDYITKDHILTKLDRNSIDVRAYKYIAAQISAVLISVIETWIENDFAEPIEFLAELTEALMYKPEDSQK